MAPAPVLAVLSALLLLAGAHAQATFGVEFYIMGRCMQVNGSAEVGVDVIGSDCVKNPNRDFSIVAAGPNYQIVYNPNPTLCVGVQSPSRNDPTLQPCSWGNNVRYDRLVVPADNTKYYYRLRASNRCLELIRDRGGESAHLFIDLVSCNGGELQQRMAAFRPSMLEFTRVNEVGGDNLCLSGDVSLGTPQNVTLQNCNPSDMKQLWTYVRSNKRLRPFDANSGLWCAKAGPVTDRPLTVVPCEDTPAELWNGNANIVPGRDASTQIYSDSGYAIDVAATQNPGGFFPGFIVDTHFRKPDTNPPDPFWMNQQVRRWECPDEPYLNFDISDGCLSCVNDDFADNACSTCEYGKDIAGICNTCLPSYSAAHDCAICEGPNQDSCLNTTHFVNQLLTSGGISDAAEPNAERCRAVCEREANCKWFNFRVSTSGTSTCWWGALPVQLLSPVSAAQSVASSVFGEPSSVCKGGMGPGFDEREHKACGACRHPGWNFTDDCGSCMGLRTLESNCLQCPNGNYDITTDCTTCVNPGLDPSEGCEAICIEANLDPASMCMNCKVGYDEASTPPCSECRTNFDILTGCTECLAPLDIGTDCTFILPNCDRPEDYEIWNVTLGLRESTNETTLTESCKAGTEILDIHRYLHCSTGSLTELSRAFQCSADWVRGANESVYATFDRQMSYTLDAIIGRARGFADDASLSWTARAKAEQLAGTWQVARARGTMLEFTYRYGPDLMNSNNVFKTRYAAPPLLMPLGTTRLLAGEAVREARFAAAQTSYRALLAPTALLDTCKAWLRGFGQCECGEEWNVASTSCIPVSTERLANLWSVHMSCALEDGLLGTSLGAELLQRTAACVDRELWKEQDLDTLSGLLALARDAALVSAANAVQTTTLVLGGATQRSIFSGIREGAVEGIGRLANSSRFLRSADAVSVARLDSVDRANDLEGKIDDDFNTNILQITILEGLDGVRYYMRALTVDISAQMEVQFDDVQRSLEGLANLVIGATEVSMEQNRLNFLTMAQGELNKANGRINTAQVELDQQRNSVQSKRSAIMGVKQDLDAMLARLPPIGEVIGDKAKEYYECRKKDELAQLARARAVAIFNVAANAIAMVAEAGALVATFGGSHSVTAMARSAASEATEAVLEAVQDEVVNELAEQTQNFAGSTLGSLGGDSGSLRDQAIGSAAGILGEDETVIGTILDGGSPSSVSQQVIDTAKDIGEAVLESVVPFYGSVKGIMEAAKVLSDYNGAKDEVKAEFRENMKKSTEALEKMGELAADLGDFASGMVLELGQLLKLVIPARSVIESTSTAAWRSIKEKIISFAKGTDVYADFLADARRRALLVDEDPEDAAAARRTLETLSSFDAIAADVDDAVGLVEPEQQQQQQSGVRGLLEARALTTATASQAVDMRRSLDSKQGCDTSPFARAGLDAFAAYFVELDNVEFFGTALHEELITVLGATRRIIVLRTEIAELNRVKAAYEGAVAELQISNAGALDEHGVLMQSVLQAAFQRTLPAITSFRPDSFERVRYTQETFLWKACNLARYRYLAVPPRCDFRMADVAKEPLGSGGDSFEASFGPHVTNIKDDFVSMREQARPTQEWVRIRVASTAEIRAALQPRGVDRDSVYPFRWSAPPPEMADLDSCGYNHELTAYIMTLEAPNHPEQLHPAFLQDISYSYSLRMDNSTALVKLDRFGNRHAFYLDAPPSEVGRREARITRADVEDCGFSNNDVESLVIRRDKHRLCVIIPDKDDFGISPVSPWGTNFSLLLMDLQEFVADADLELDLVMYARLRGEGTDPSECAATQFIERGTQTAGAGSGDDDSGGDTAVIIGAALGAFVVVFASALFAKRVRDNRRNNVPWAKAFSVNPSAQSLPEF